MKLFKKIKHFFKIHTNNEDTEPGRVYDKTKRKAYNKLWKEHKKNLKRIAKKATPYQFDDGLQLFVEFIRFQYDYYSLGYNVWAMERVDEDPVRYKDVPKRAESLKQALDEYEAWQNCEDKYYIYHETGGIENGKGSVWTILNKDGTERQEQQDHWIEHLLPDPDENRKACEKETEEHKKKFFDLVQQWMDEWWD